MLGLLAPEFEEVVTGDAEVREIFRVPRVGTIAGCYVHQRRHHPRLQGPLPPGGHDHLEGRHHVAAALQGRRPRGRTPASSAASASPTSRTSSPATSSRPSRSGRSPGPGRRSATGAGAVRRSCPWPCTCWHWPSTSGSPSQSLKDKRSVMPLDPRRRPPPLRGRGGRDRPATTSGSGPSSGSPRSSGSATPRHRGDRRGRAVRVVVPRDRGRWRPSAHWLEVDAMSRRSSDGHGHARQYPRTARLNELLREILGRRARAPRRRPPRAGHHHRRSTSTATCDRAVVFYDSLAGEDGDEEVLEALDEARRGLQAAVGRQARIRAHAPSCSSAPTTAIRDRRRASTRSSPTLARSPDDEPSRPMDAATAPTADGRDARRARVGRRRDTGGPDGLVVVDKPAGLDHPRRGGQAARRARHPQGRPLRHARPRRHRRAAARRRPGHPAAAVPHRAAQDLHVRDRARHRDRHPRRRRARSPPPTTWPALTADAGAGGRARPRRRHPAGAADGLGREGRRQAPPRAGPGGRSRSSASPARSPCTASTVEPTDDPLVVPGRGRVLVGHLRAHPGRRPRPRARRRRPPAGPAPHRRSARSPSTRPCRSSRDLARGAAHPGRGAARLRRGRRRPTPTPSPSATARCSTLERLGFARRRAVGRGRRRRPPARRLRAPTGARP